MKGTVLFKKNGSLILFWDYNFEFEIKGIVAARTFPLPARRGIRPLTEGVVVLFSALINRYLPDFLLVPLKNPLLLPGRETGATDKNGGTNIARG